MRKLVDFLAGVLLLMAFIFYPASARAAGCTNSDPAFLGYTVVPAFTNFTVQSPVCITSPPGETNRLFILEQDGRIVVITNLATPNRTVFMSITNRIEKRAECGLVGMAFHPGYATNRYFYIFYTFTNSSGGLFDRVARFQTDPTNPNVGLLNTELPLITQSDLALNHQGGDLHFGPDGYLYVSLGDEGGSNDQYQNSQKITRDFFSGILRIDVDKRPGNLAPNSHPSSSTNYLVPSDNPFVGAASFNGKTIDPTKVRTEFWAVGLRNPWRITFDEPTGLLYCADVGQEAREEIDIIIKGGNYGWNYREGNIPGSGGTPPAGFQRIDPILDYSHGAGSSTNGGDCVIGGVVYHGQKLTQLVGCYVFGDFVSGNIWWLRADGTNPVPHTLIAGDLGMSAFGTDPRDGEILIASYRGNTIRKLALKPDHGPTVSFLSPPNNSRITNGPLLNVTGAAQDDSQICQVFYKLNDGDFQPATGTANWNCPISMLPGTNRVAVKSVDDAGNESAVTNRIFVYVVTNQLTINITGNGTVTPNLNNSWLEIGKWYSVHAMPATSYVFTNWSGDIASTNSTLKFLMQSNLLLHANFILSPFLPFRGTYNGLFLSSDAVTLQNAGFLTLSLGDRGALTGMLKVGGASYPMTGNFLFDGTATTHVTRLGKSTINVSLQLNLATPDDTLRGSLNGGLWSADLLAYRSIYSTTNPATTLAGNYTMVLPPDANGPNDLSGYGYGFVQVGIGGTAQLTGALADSSAISQSVSVSKTGQWPLYVPLYYGYSFLTNNSHVTTAREYKGFLLGWLAVTNSPALSLTGNLTWLKAPWTNNYFTNGFTNQIAATGSVFHMPSQGHRIINFTNFTATFTNGNLISHLTQTLQLSTNNTLSFVGPNSISLVLHLHTANGLVDGTFVDPDSGSKTFKGALLQNQDYGAGYFLGTNASGSLLLQPQ